MNKTSRDSRVRGAVKSYFPRPGCSFTHARPHLAKLGAIDLLAKWPKEVPGRAANRIMPSGPFDSGLAGHFARRLPSNADTRCPGNPGSIHSTWRLREAFAYDGRSFPMVVNPSRWAIRTIRPVISHLSHHRIAEAYHPSSWRTRKVPWRIESAIDKPQMMRPGK